MNISESIASEYQQVFGVLTLNARAGLLGLARMISANQSLTDPRQVAYLLATIKHETAHTFQPVIERGQRAYFNRYDPSTRLGKALGNSSQGDGYRFRGRGYVQITGRRNYQKLSSIVARDLVAKPEDACLPEVAFQIAVVGMLQGLFTGKAIGRYINERKCDYVNARRVINGTDKAETIAFYAERFEELLKKTSNVNSPGKQEKEQ